MFEKVKGVMIKYKWWVIGAVGALAAYLLMRGDSGGGTASDYMMQGSGPIQMSNYDPTMDLAQLSAQTALASQRQDYEGQRDLDQLGYEHSRYTTDANVQLGMAEIDMNKFLGNLQAETVKYQGDIQLQTEGIRAGVAHAEIGAQKYIVGQQASIAKYEAKTARRGQDMGFVTGLLNFGSKYF